MEKLNKIFILCMVAFMLSGTTAFAGSKWCAANGKSYSPGYTYKKASYDGIVICISKIAKDGKTTDNSAYKKAKVKVSGDSSVTWSHSSGNMDTQESKQTAERVCTKGKSYTFLLTDGNGNVGMTSAVATAYRGNTSTIDAEVYVTETIY